MDGRRPRHRLLAVALATLLVPLVVGSASAARPEPKVDICHLDHELGTYALISVSASSVAAHLAQGDGLPGEGTFDSNCQVVVEAARAFARAYRDVDGVNGYDPSSDVLYSEVVDTNGNDVLDVGDTVMIFAYPLDFSGATGSVGAPTHVVTSVDQANTPSIVQVTTAEGSFIWGTNIGGELYLEAGPLFQTILSDSASSDLISVVSGSPSQPVTPMVVNQVSQGDDAWLEIAITP